MTAPLTKGSHGRLQIGKGRRGWLRLRNDKNENNA
nr:MAG TPA: SERINE/THREONINE-PROTEIN KINASE OSR1 [Bacteriophage sp.]